MRSRLGGLGSAGKDPDAVIVIAGLAREFLLKHPVPPEVAVKQPGVPLESGGRQRDASRVEALVAEGSEVTPAAEL